MIKLCPETGAISKIPDIPGLILWTDGHVGISIGGGYAIEARGFNYGVVRTRIKDRTWKKWGKLKLLTYVATETEPAEPVLEGANPYAEPTQALAKGSRGEGVKWLQWSLVKNGFGVGSCGIDGEYGDATRAAVLKFQQKHMETDGATGALTLELLKRSAQKGATE